MPLFPGDAEEPSHCHGEGVCASVSVCACVCARARSAVGAATTVRETLDLHVGLPGMGPFKILQKAPRHLVPSFVSKPEVGRFPNLLPVSQCPSSPAPNALRQRSHGPLLSGSQKREAWAWDSGGSRGQQPGARL